MVKRATALGSCLVLTACFGATEYKTKIVTPVCKEYSKSQEQAEGKELASIPADKRVITTQWISDYVKTLNECHALAKASN